MRHRLTLLSLLLTVATVAGADQPEKSKIRHSRDKVLNEYIVVLEDDVPADDVAAVADQLTRAHDAVLVNVWKDALKGFSANMSDARAEAMSRKKEVKYIEENSFAYLSSDHQTNIDPRTCDPTTNPSCSTVVDNRLWHLDRADQNYADPTNSYAYCTDGTGITVYMIDGGVNRHHNEFGNAARIKPGYNATGTATTNDQMPADDPCMGFAVAPGGFYQTLEKVNYELEITGGAGHGTAVASVLGGKRVGIAKNVNIVPIKTSRCDQFSARARRSAQFYTQNETMFRPTGNAAILAIYRATNSGTTAGTDPHGSSDWPSADNVEVPDGGVGGVVWKAIPATEWQNVQTTAMMVNGLNWILSGANTQGPKSYAIVTMSQWRHPNDPQDPNVPGTTDDTLEGVVRMLLANNITVIASANNQNGNACDTSPARLSAGNPVTSLQSNVITVGGSMLRNRPWAVNISDTSGTEADGGGKGTEPAFAWKEGVRDARWICGAGDSDDCSNVALNCAGFQDLARCTVNPTNVATYIGFAGGSNGGPCVTLFAPAKNLFVASPSAANGYRDARLKAALASGTSWSAPIAAGFAARVMQASGNLTPVQMRTALENSSAADLDTATLQTYDYTGAPITPLAPNKLLHLSDVSITAHPQSTPSALSGPTPLTVGTGGTSARSYKWFEVILEDGANPGFDAATYKRGAHPPDSSLEIAGATSSTYDAPVASVRKAYWVRATNLCGSADSDIAVVVPRPGAPSNAVATASGASVTVTWTTAAGAEQYQIERKIAGQPWVTAGTVGSGTLSFTETPGAPGGMVVYRVRATAGSAYLPPQSLATSNPTNNDFANLNAGSYEALATPPSYTSIKAQHVIELRQAVNALCDSVGAAQEFQATDLLLSSLQGSVIQASDFTALMTKINNIRTNGSLAVGTASFGQTPAAGLTIAGAHLESLRNALK